MKMFTTMLLVYWGLTGSALAEPDHTSTLKEIRATRPCEQKTVQVNAYLNASRHGVWLSNSIGSIKMGVPLLIRDGSKSEPSMKRLLNYIHQPKAYLNQTFRGTFHGVIECGKQEKLPPTLIVSKVTNIRITPIRNAVP